MCKLYNVSTQSANKARCMLFAKVADTDKLPPTSDAFKYHAMRVHFQSMVWRQANIPIQRLPRPEDMGWKIEENCLVPILMSLDPIPQACIEMIHCQCTTGCSTLRCKCCKSKLVCTSLCTCVGRGTACINHVN